MRKTIITLAAAAVVSLGAAGAASAAPNSGLDFSAQNGAGIQKVSFGYGYRHRLRCKRLYRLAFIHGSAWAKAKYFRICRTYGGGGYRQLCKRLYYKGFVLGHPRAKFQFRRLCRGYGSNWGYKARVCKRLYYKAFVLGLPGAKYRYYRLCTHRRVISY